MREIAEQLRIWRRQGERFAVAKVVDVEGSSPREIGSSMAVSADAVVAGSVSGGCVEGAVVTEALAALGAEKAVMARVGMVGNDTATIGCARTVTFGYSDDEAFAVGLTCGGTLHILIDPDPSAYIDEALRRLESDEPFVIVTVFNSNDAVDASGEYFAEVNRDIQLPEVGSSMLVSPDGTVMGSLGNSELDRVVTRDGIGLVEHGTSTKRHYGRNGQSRAQEVEVLFEVYARTPRMVIFGAVDFTRALSQVAKVLGYDVVVCDARPIFATRERFPEADEVVVEWPHRYLERCGDQLTERDAICVLTHDPKFDVPALTAALATRVRYIGAMGSRRTHAERTERLVEAGVPASEVEARIMGPIGLDIGARTPEETAISILAELIAKREAKDVPHLAASSGSIHRR